MKIISFNPPLSPFRKVGTDRYHAEKRGYTPLVTVQVLVVAAAFRLRQSAQAEACGYKIPLITERLPLFHKEGQGEITGENFYSNIQMT
jgi:hypothetical protein